MPQFTLERLNQLKEYNINREVFPQQARANLNKKFLDDNNDFLRWKDERLRCLADPLFLGDVLGMDFQENPHRLLFQQFIQMNPTAKLSLFDLSEKIKKFMILWPRGLFKTSAVIVWIIQIILNYPNVRLCFLTGSDELAVRQLDRVKRFFEQPTDRFRELFPEFCTKSAFAKSGEAKEDALCKMGNKHVFTVPARTNHTFAEGTFQISTAKTVKAGSHFDIIFVDDLVNEQNYKSAKALEKCYQDYIDIIPLLEPNGFILMTGTRYSWGDTYELIQDMAKKEEKELGKSIWQFSIRDCWSHGCKNCGHTSVYHDYRINILQPPCTATLATMEQIKCACPGFQDNATLGVLFPETRTRDGRTIGHTIEKLESLRIQMGPEFFANQYENNPIAVGAQTFTDELISKQTLFHEAQIPKYNESLTFCIGDLAYIGQEDRDYSVIFTIRVFQGQIFTYRCEFGNWDSSAVAENVIGLLLTERPLTMYLEKFNGWEAYDTIIRAHARKMNMPVCPIVWLKGSQASKAKLARIGSSKQPLKDRRLWLYAHMKGYDVLCKQLTKWPKLGKRDDFADALGMIVGAPIDWGAVNPPALTFTTDWLRKLQNAESVDDSYGDNGCGSGIVC
jgi:hypothetical protein